MKGIFASILVSLVVLLSFASVTQAQPLSTISSIVFAVEPVQEDVMEQLKTQVLPQIQSILNPEQQKQLETAIVESKTSMRKALKSLTLTPGQKTQLATVFKTLPKKEIFTAMTPAQKQEFFMKKKAFFKPTPEEIAEYKTKQGQNAP
jgi:hypothetical protein